MIMLQKIAIGDLFELKGSSYDFFDKKFELLWLYDLFQFIFV